MASSDQFLSFLVIPPPSPFPFSFRRVPFFALADTTYARSVGEEEKKIALGTDINLACLLPATAAKGKKKRVAKHLEERLESAMGKKRGLKDRSKVVCFTSLF